MKNFSRVIRALTHDCRSVRPGGLAHPRLSLAPVVFFCLGFAFVAQPAAGQDNTWLGPANVIDFFSNAGEWSLGVPDGSTNITVPQGGVLGDTSFTNSQTLTIGAPAELVLLSGTTWANTWSVVDNVTLSINSGATLSNNLGTFGGTGTYLNSGAIQGAGQIGDSTLGFPTLINQAGGTISANVSVQQLSINGVFVSNAGLMEATAGGTLSFTNGSIISNQGGIIDSNGGEVLLIGSTVQGGTLNNVSGTIAGISATLDGSTAASAVTILGTFTGNSGTRADGEVNSPTTKEERRAQHAAPLQENVRRERRYCQRRATAGSTRSARQAGSAAAASVTSTVNPVAAAYTSGSAGLTPTSIADATRASAAAASEPTSRPAPANAKPCRMTTRMMSAGCAPRVTRMPISLVRCATE